MASLLLKSASKAATSKLHSILLLAFLLTLQATPSRAFDPSNDDGTSNPYTFGQSDTFNYSYNPSRGQKALVAHAVLACTVWAFLVPVGGILLRSRLNSPWIVRIHAVLQVTSLMAYIAAVCLGISLIHTRPYSKEFFWNDAHPRLGLAILVMALFQPVLGYIHHGIIKRKKQENVQIGRFAEMPGRTVPGIMHTWLGRIVIILGMINGGLGLRLAGVHQVHAFTVNAEIGYGCGAASMALIYLFFIVRFERSDKEKPATVMARGTVLSAFEHVKHKESLPGYGQEEGTMEIFTPEKAPEYEEKEKEKIPTFG